TGRGGNISLSSQSLSSCFARTGRKLRTSPLNDFATTGVNAPATATARAFALRVFGDCAFADEKKPKLSSARNTPDRKTNRPIKTRRLKNADCEVDFLFIFFCNEVYMRAEPFE